MSNTVLYLITVLIWGSTWLAIEFQLGTVEPEVSIVYRYAIASFFLFIYCKIKSLKLLFHLKYHVWFALLGASLFCLNYVFAYRAQVHITSALAAIAFSTMLWINIVLSRLIFGTRAGRRVLIGAFLGILGIITLFAPRSAKCPCRMKFSTARSWPCSERSWRLLAICFLREHKNARCRSCKPMPGACCMGRS